MFFLRLESGQRVPSGEAAELFRRKKLKIEALFRGFSAKALLFAIRYYDHQETICMELVNFSGELRLRRTVETDGWTVETDEGDEDRNCDGCH